jgi:hypothetical protein
MSNGCKVNNVLIVFKDIKARAKRAKALETHANFSVCPKAKLCPNQCRGCQSGKIKIEQN